MGVAQQQHKKQVRRAEFVVKGVKEVEYTRSRIQRMESQAGVQGL